MSATVTSNPETGKDLTDAEFVSLAKYAKGEFGLSLSESKKSLVQSRLARRFRARNVSGFEDYMRLMSSEGADGERQELISALTTNVTSFFRENHHFDTLKNECVPKLKEKAQNGQRVRMWSSACSSGQEPYSMAMTVMSAWPDVAKTNTRILATDIDTNIVSRAEQGRYPIEEIDGLPSQIGREMTRKLGDGGEFEISKPVKDLITFARLNLIEEWPFAGPFDVIFCRNVAIYFEKDTQQRLWKRFCSMLEPGGYLFIGHSERITGPALDLVEGVGITSYRKLGADSSPR